MVVQPPQVRRENVVQVLFDSLSFFFLCLQVLDTDSCVNLQESFVKVVIVVTTLDAILSSFESQLWYGFKDGVEALQLDISTVFDDLNTALNILQGVRENQYFVVSIDRNLIR